MRQTSDPLLRRRAFFRTVALNRAGWSVLLGTGLVTGGLVAMATPLPIWSALLTGIVVAILTALLWDRHRYRNAEVHLGDSRLDEESGMRIIEELKLRGITAAYVEFTDEDEEGIYVIRGITCKQRDMSTLREMIEHL